MIGAECAARNLRKIGRVCGFADGTKARAARQGWRVCGFTYLALLFVVALMGVSLAAGGVVWHVAQQREKESELLFIGTQFRQAISSYYEGSPGPKRYPTQLADLVRDPRFPGVRRHLRRVYLDPITGKAEWGVARNFEGGIIGVYSLSEQTPIRRHFRDGPYKDFTGKVRYADWKFVYLPVVAPGAPAPADRDTRVRSVR
jgi:type II secretory pathway pseudopilin PulG